MNRTRRLSLERWPDEPQVLERGPDVRPRAERVARGLGWFSLALGAVELLAPRRLARVLGLRGAEPLLRACGARELASGVATLAVAPQAGLWSRVGGDVLDLALLGAAARRRPRRGLRRAGTRRNLGIAIAAVAAVLVVDALAAASLQRQHARRRPPRDYSDRSGFARPAAELRGTARPASTPPPAPTPPALRDTVEDQTRPLH
jgi:hypothetical protein